MISALLLAAALSQSTPAAPPSKLGDEDVAKPTPPPATATRDPLADIALALDPTRPEAERIEAIEGLGGSGDARVLSILTSLAQDRSRGIHLAAVNALGDTPTRESQEVLVRIVREPRFPFGAREEAIRALATQEAEGSAEALGVLATDKSLPGSLATLARKELEEENPEQAAALAPTAAPVPYKRAPDRALPMALGAGFGGYTLWTLGVLGQNSAGGGLGLVTGAAVGAAAGYLLAPDLTPTQTAFYGVTTGLGTWAGLGIGLAALQQNTDDRFLHLFGVGGELLGATAGYLLWDRFKLQLEADDIKTDNGFRLTGVMLGAPALHLLASLDDSRHGTSPSNVSILSGDTFFKLMAIASGIAIGGGVGELAGRTFQDGRGGYVASGTGWGLGLGLLTSAALVRQPNLYQLEGGALLGGLAGLGLGFATWSPELTAGDVLTVNTLGLTGAAAGLGLAGVLWDDSSTFQSAATMIAVGSGVGLVGGRALTRHLKFSGGDTGLMGLTSLHGAFVGALMPDFFGSTTGEQRFGSALLGASAGLIGGGLLAQKLDVPPKATGTMLLADFFGSLTGLGIGNLAMREDATSMNLLHASTLIGGTGGLLGAALLSERLEVDSGDGVLVPVATAIGLWNGVAFAGGIGAEGRKLGGSALLGAGLGGLSGLVLSQLLTLSPGDVAAAGSGSLWGTYLALSAMLVTRTSFDSGDLLLLLVASDLGLGVTSLLLSPVANVRPEQIGIASLFGIGGAAAAVLASSLFTRDGNFLLGANLGGAVVGLGVGALVASNMEPMGAEPQSAEGGGGGLSLGPVPIRFQGLTTAPMMDPEGRMSGAALVAQFDND